MSYPPPSGRQWSYSDGYDDKRAPRAKYSSYDYDYPSRAPGLESNSTYVASSRHGEYPASDLYDDRRSYDYRGGGYRDSSSYGYAQNMPSGPMQDPYPYNGYDMYPPDYSDPYYYNYAPSSSSSSSSAAAAAAAAVSSSSYYPPADTRGSYPPSFSRSQRQHYGEYYPSETTKTRQYSFGSRKVPKQASISSRSSAPASASSSTAPSSSSSSSSSSTSSLSSAAAASSATSVRPCDAKIRNDAPVVEAKPAIKDPAVEQAVALSLSLIDHRIALALTQLNLSPSLCTSTENTTPIKPSAAAITLASSSVTSTVDPLSSSPATLAPSSHASPACSAPPTGNSSDAMHPGKSAVGPGLRVSSSDSVGGTPDAIPLRRSNSLKESSATIPDSPALKRSLSSISDAYSNGKKVRSGTNAHASDAWVDSRAKRPGASPTSGSAQAKEDGVDSTGMMHRSKDDEARRPGTADACVPSKARHNSHGIAPSPSSTPAAHLPVTTTAGTSSTPCTPSAPLHAHTPLASSRSFDKNSEERRRAVAAAVSLPLSSGRKGSGSYPADARGRGFHSREGREGRESRERGGHAASEDKQSYLPRDTNDYYSQLSYNNAHAYYRDQQAYWDGEDSGGGGGGGSGAVGGYRGYDYDRGYPEASMQYDYRDSYYPPVGYSEAPHRTQQYDGYTYRDRDGRERERRMRRGDGF